MADAILHPIPPGLWCVPTAIYALTGADPESVIQPALNRHGKSPSLHRLVTGATVSAAIATLAELNYRCRCYKGGCHRVSSWGTLTATKYQDRAIFLRVPGHVLVAKDGRIYDTFTPHGAPGADHPYATAVVTAAYLVEKE